MTYKLAGKYPADAPPHLAGKDIKRIIRKEDGAQIPFDTENTAYQEYLEWLKIDGNEPEAAD
tara:strand:- start:117 stop:302 length:186 start_codon:yes stop_codon:yes gene_type:complete